MPKAVIPRSSALVPMVTGLAGAFSGMAEGEKEQQRKREVQSAQNEQIREYDLTQQESKRQFDEDLTFRVKQLEVLQNEGMLNRTQESRLAEMREEMENVRLGQQITSQEKQAALTLAQRESESKRQAGVDYTRIQKEKEARDMALEEERQRRITDPLQKVQELRITRQESIKRFGVEPEIATPEQQLVLATEQAQRVVGPENFGLFAPDVQQKHIQDNLHMIQFGQEYEEATYQQALREATDSANIQAEMQAKAKGDVAALRDKPLPKLTDMLMPMTEQTDPIAGQTGVAPWDYDAIGGNWYAGGLQGAEKVRSCETVVMDLRATAMQAVMGGSEQYDIDLLGDEAKRTVDAVMKDAQMDDAVKKMILDRLHYEIGLAVRPLEAEIPGAEPRSISGGLPPASQVKPPGGKEK